MAEIFDYDSTAANNNSASPNGAPEGMAPSGVNDTMREMMARMKRAIFGDVTSRDDDAGASAGPDLTLWRNSSTPADSDEIGQIKFDGEDSGGNQTTYAALRAKIEDVTDTTEDGALHYYAMVAGTLTDIGELATLNDTTGTLKSFQTFTSSGTWTKPSGVNKVIVEVQGAGGGGGGAPATSAGEGSGGGGGGAGGYARKLIDVSSIASSTITIGSGGAGNSGSSGSAGGNSSWADGTNTVTANGGSGGSSIVGGANFSTNSGGAGGTASGGDINVAGGGGGCCARGDSNGMSGAGGNSVLGGGGRGQGFTSGGSNGAAGGNYGAGGGGSANAAGAAAKSGGAGADGLVYVLEFS